MTEPLVDTAGTPTTAATATAPLLNVGYVLVGSYETVQVLSQTEIIDAIYCTIQTKPSGVVASIAIPKNVFDTGQAGTNLLPFAQAIEQIMADPRVTAGAGDQDLDAASLLRDSVAFTVEYRDPVRAPYGATAIARVPVGVALLEHAGVGEPALAAATAIIDGVYANLRAAAGG